MVVSVDTRYGRMHHQRRWRHKYLLKNLIRAFKHPGPAEEYLPWLQFGGVVFPILFSTYSHNTTLAACLTKMASLRSAHSPCNR